jgi:parallel beta-helix repeat protein
LTKKSAVSQETLTKTLLLQKSQVLSKGLHLKKKALAAVSIFILLSTVIIGFLFVNSASANGIPAPPINHIYIRSDGTVEPSTAPLLRDGNIYVLTSDMPNSTIIVERDNIVIDGAGYGIHGYGTSYYDGITISYRTNITIKNTDISPFGYGVRMDYASNNTITGNKMRAFTGVSLLYSDYNQIIGNVVTDGYGVQGLGSNNLIIGNNFTSGLSGGGNGMGIYMTGNNNTISQNTIIHEVSINLGPSAQYNTISYNTILKGEAGILIAKSSNNLIFGNIIKEKMDSRTGSLYLSYDSFNNIIFANQFENNALAVSLGAQVADFVWNNVYNNTFYRNNFINNAQSVWIAPRTPVNYWDDGKQGNYWSNFHGIDSNGDGISETPYEITGNNTDHHPLMKPIGISTPNLPSSSPTPQPTAQPNATPLPPPTVSPSPSPPPTASPSPEPSQKPPLLQETQNSEPFPTTLVAATSGASVALVGVGLLVYFKKRKH